MCGLDADVVRIAMLSGGQMRTTVYVVAIVALPILFGANAYAGKPTGVKQAQPTRDAADVLTVAGCVQGEAGYRSQIGDGKGGVAGTGLGESHEFVLRAVRTVSTETLKPIDKPGKGEDVYLLTGKLESELGKAVGHQVAVSGYVKVKETNGTRKVEDLPEMVVVGWHNISDHCSASPKTAN
jgi:hypothetical protein